MVPELEGRVAWGQRRVQLKVPWRIPHCLKTGNSGVPTRNLHFVYIKVGRPLTCPSYVKFRETGGQKRSKSRVVGALG